METLNYLWSKKKNVEDFLGYAKKAVNIYESQIAKDIINIIPSSDDTARKQYQGEKHALLILKNNRTGFANYMGPGTHLIQRLKDHDPPRTYSDQVAKIHDCNYALSTFEPTKAKQLKDIRNADALMINQLKEARNKGLDNRVNIAIGEKLIQAKVALEDIGVLDKDKFVGKLKMYPENDKKLLLEELKKSDASL